MQILCGKRFNLCPDPWPPASASPASHPSAAPAAFGSSPASPTPKFPLSPTLPPMRASLTHAACTNPVSAYQPIRFHNPLPHNCARSPGLENASPRAANSSPPQPRKPRRQTATASQSRSSPPRARSSYKPWNEHTSSLASPPHALHPPWCSLPGSGPQPTRSHRLSARCLCTPLKKISQVFLLAPVRAD